MLDEDDVDGLVTCVHCGREPGRMTDPGPVPRITLSLDEAALALGISRDSLERHVLHDLRVIRRNRLRLIPVSELQRWADDAAERTLDR